jgi:ribosome-associated translation inhibitor RaiA
LADVELHVFGDVPRAEAARERVAEVLGAVDDPPPRPIRLALRHEARKDKRSRFIADASVPVGDQGRLVAAHATGPSPEQAAEEVADRLKRQLRRVVDADVALRNEPRVIQAALDSLPPNGGHRPEAGLKPPEEREIVERRTYADASADTLAAVADLLDLDLEFLLFRHVRTGEDVVVYRRDDGRIGLLHPQGSELADENDIVVPEPSRYSEPLTLVQARDEMDVLNHRFLYFVDAEDGRGKVIYLRHDGDYGLVEPL